MMKCNKCDGTGHLFYGYDDCSHCDECEGTGKSFAKYSIIVRGIGELNEEQEKIIIDVIMLADDFERLRKWIK